MILSNSLPSLVSDFYGRAVTSILVIAGLMAEDPEGFIAEVEFRIVSFDDSE